MIHHVIHQAATLRFRAAEFQGPTADAFLSPDRQSLFQVQQAARAGGGCGGGVGFGGQGLGEAGEQGGPLAGQAFVAVFLQDLVDELLRPPRRQAARRSIWDSEQRRRQLCSSLGDKGEAAQAGAFLLAGGGAQRGYGGIDGGEEVLGDRRVRVRPRSQGVRFSRIFRSRRSFAPWLRGSRRGAQEGGDGAVAAGVAAVQEAQGG